MLIHQMVTSCDATDEKFENFVEGIAVLAQGATGRWCEVLNFGPTEAKRLIDAGNEVLTIEEARAKIEASGNGWPDF